MAGLGPAIHVFLRLSASKKVVDARLKAGHDGEQIAGSIVTDVLRGVRVLELGTMITAPLAGMMLADLGAEVIKIEHPQGGDPFRSFRGGQYSPHFVAYNRGKRSMQLDLRNATGRKILHKLLG